MTTECIGTAIIAGIVCFSLGGSLGAALMCFVAGVRDDDQKTEDPPE